MELGPSDLRLDPALAGILVIDDLRVHIFPAGRRDRLFGDRLVKDLFVEGIGYIVVEGVSVYEPAEDHADLSLFGLHILCEGLLQGLFIQGKAQVLQGRPEDLPAVLLQDDLPLPVIRGQSRSCLGGRLPGHVLPVDPGPLQEGVSPLQGSHVIGSGSCDCRQNRHNDQYSE